MKNWDRRRVRRGLLVFFLLFALGPPPLVGRAATSEIRSEAKIQRSVVFTTKEKTPSYDFPKIWEQGGRSCLLADVSYEKLAEQELTKTEVYEKTITSPPLADASDYQPVKAFEKGGLRYVLARTSSRQVTLQGRSVPLTATMCFVNPREEAPQKAVFEVSDPLTGEKVKRELSLRRFSQTQEWREAPFTMTISDYDASLLQLGEKTVENPGDISVLMSCEAEILALLSLSTEDARLCSLNWQGAAYEEKGVCRRKLAGVVSRKRILLEADYGDTVALPDAVCTEVSAVYQARAEKKTGSRCTFRATATYEVPVAETTAPQESSSVAEESTAPPETESSQAATIAASFSEASESTAPTEESTEAADGEREFSLSERVLPAVAAGESVLLIGFLAAGFAKKKREKHD